MAAQEQQAGSGWDWDFPDLILEPGEALSDGKSKEFHSFVFCWPRSWQLLVTW
jgi:hypothetical protein